MENNCVTNLSDFAVLLVVSLVGKLIVHVLS